MSEISGSNWSETAASNNAAPPDGAPEGHTMSNINNIQREVMAQVKRFWNRIQGAYASTGSANAYVVTPTEALAAYVTGERYSFRSSFANTGSATVNISALGAKTIQKMTSAGLANLASGDIQSGQPVTVEYNGTVMIMTTPPASLGKVAQVVNTQTGTSATGTTTVPLDNTKPQQSPAEGTQFMTLAVTPTNASSTLLIDVKFVGAVSTSTTIIVVLYQDSGADAIAVDALLAGTADQLFTLSFRHKMTAGTTSATTFKVWAGPAAAATLTFNGRSGSGLFNGLLTSSITITEVLP